jgi:hypothetical protein
MQEFSVLNIFLLVLGGGLAGFINTLAGGGSFLTIPLLIFLGLPPTVANATNRLGVFMQSLTATRQLHSHGVFPVRFSLIIAIPAVLGSVLGTYGALMISDDAFKKYLAVFMVLMTLSTFLKPSAILPRPVGNYTMRRWALLWLLFLRVGLYRGFIQAGVGFLIIAAMVLTGYDLVAGNATKSFVILLLTCVSLAIFWAGGKVQVVPGVALGAGSMLGAFIGSHVTITKGNDFIRKFVVAMVILSAIFLLVK